MNIHDAAKSGHPFFHKDMIGAYKFVNGKLIHRDNIYDYRSSDDVLDKLCAGFEDLAWMTPDDLLRDDWEIVVFQDN